MMINIGKYDGTFLVKMDLFGEEVSGSGQTLFKATNSFSSALVEYSNNILSRIEKIRYVYQKDKLNELNDFVINTKFEFAQNGWDMCYTFWNPDISEFVKKYTTVDAMVDFEQGRCLKYVTVYKEYEWKYVKFCYTPQNGKEPEGYCVYIQHAYEPVIYVQNSDTYDFNKNLRKAVYEQIFKHFEHMV